MDSTKLKPVMKELKAGHYHLAYEYIVKNNLEPVIGDNGLNVLITAVQGLKTSNDSPKYLAEIIQMLKFEALDGSQLLNYLACIFHIVKYIIKSKKLEFITQLGQYIIPPFIENNQLEDTHIEYLKYLANILHNNFLDILGEIRKHGTDVIFTNCKLLIGLSVYTENFLTRAENYISSLLYRSYDSDKLMELYKYMCSLIKGNDPEKCKENFKFLMVMLLNMCKYFVGKKDFGLVLEYLKISETKLVDSAGDNGDFVKKVLAVSPLFTTFNFYPETVFEILDNFTQMLIEASKSVECKFYIDLMIPLVTMLFDEVIKASEDCDIEKMVNISFARSFFKLADTLAKLSSGIKFECCCDINCDIYTVLKAVTIKSYLMKHLINLERFDEDLHIAVLNHFMYWFSILTTLRNKNCKLFVNQWRQAGVILYIMATKLYQMKDKACMKYLKLFCKATLEIEGVENNLIKENISSKALYWLVDILMTNCYYQKGLQISALNIFLYPKNSKFALQQWVKCKNALGEEFRKVTLISVLNDNENDLKTYYGGFQKVTDLETIIDLLLLELNSYKKHWPFSVYNLLCELKRYLDYVKLAKEITLIEYIDVIKLDRNILKEILEPCIKHLEAVSKNEELHLVLGHLYFLYFKFSFLDLMDKNYKEFNSINLPPKPEQPEPVDINNECDINTSYKFLEITTCNQTLQYLNKSLDSFNIVMQLGIKDSSLVNKNLVNISMELAYEFKLHCNVLDFLKAMFLTIEFAKTLEDNGLVIKTTSAIMEHLDVNSKKFQSLKNHCDDVIATVKNLDLKIYCQYYTSLSLAYIKCDRFKECNEMYEKASHYYYKFQSDSDTELDSNIIKLYYLYLETILANIACMNSVTNHDSLALSRLYSIYCFIIRCLKSGKNISPDFLTISMDAMEYLLNFYVCMRLPREVRCFGRGIYELAQELILPFRVVRLTVYLAKADILSCRFADCEVKLEKLSNILGLSRNTFKEDEDLCEITIKVEDLCLENPSMQRITSANSPKLFTSKFKLPSFTKHVQNCDCFPCSSIEYKDLVMQKIHLDAMLSAAHDDSKSTLEYFKGLSSINEHISNIQIQTPENISLNISFWTSTYNQILLDHVRYYVKTCELGKARILNTQLYKKMRLESNKSFHMFNEVLKLLWALNDDSIDIIQDDSVEALELIDENQKTPEKEVKRPALLSPLALKFKESSKKSPNLQAKSPNFLAPKTPITSFKIYTPETNLKKPMNSARRMVRKNLCNDLENTKSTEKTLRTKRLANKLKKPGMKIFCDEIDGVGDEKLKKPTPRSTRKTKAQKILEPNESTNLMTPGSAFSDSEERVSHLELIKSAEKKKLVPKSTLAQRLLNELESTNPKTRASTSRNNEDKPTHLRLVKKNSNHSKNLTPAFQKFENYLLQPKKSTPSSTKKNVAKHFSDVPVSITGSASKGAVRKFTRRKQNDTTVLEDAKTMKQSTDINIFESLKGPTNAEIVNDVFDSLKTPTVGHVFTSCSIFDTLIKPANAPNENNITDENCDISIGEMLQDTLDDSKETIFKLTKKCSAFSGKETLSIQTEIANSEDDSEKNETAQTLVKMEDELANLKSIKSVCKKAVSKVKDMPLKEMQTDEVVNLKSVRKKLDMDDVVEKKSSRLKKLADSTSDVKARRTTRRKIN